MKSMTGIITDHLVDHYQKQANNHYITFTEVTIPAFRNEKSRRFDMIAMKRTYKLEIWGFEVKTSRRDFCNDGKWQEYLPYCNKFYFVAPPGLIKKNEVQDGIGLVEINSDTGRFRWVKPTPYRTIEMPSYMLLSIIFNKLESDVCPLHRSARKNEHYQKHLKLMREGNEIGRGIAWELEKKLSSIRDKAAKIEFAEAIITQHNLYFFQNTTTEDMINRYQTRLEQMKPKQEQNNIDIPQNRIARIRNEIAAIGRHLDKITREAGE